MRWLHRSWIALCALAACSAGALGAAAPTPGTFQTPVPHAVLIEAESGAVLYEKSADQMIAPASLAKLMTAEVVFNQIATGKLTLDNEFTVSENAWRKGGAPARGSTMYAILNSSIKVRDLLQGVIIQSGNDACIVLAEGIAGSEANFAKLMNSRARALGMTKSNFTNPHGLPDPGMRVTVRELGRLARHIIHTYPEHYSWYGAREFTWNNIRQYNRNPLLALNIGADGMKTGFTREAGYGLVGSAVQNGMRLIIVVSGAKTEKERADEAKRILEWGFRAFETRNLFAEGQVISEAKLYGAEKGRVPLMSKTLVKMMVPRGLSERIVARVVYKGPVPAPVQEGQQIGTLKVWRGDTLALETPLYATESIGVGTTTQRAIDAATELVIGLFRAGADRL